ncbi:hypothetical protein NDU88_002070 [Pleurodeles waltl]|uniref:Uncharacterized protein n=1 Tax=Pleurodeles waltl TaxID=8319 RepID=A0AAV7RES8_PLEWA|nr:hypothetical protein NDU88_002070 [Pleurodeles waltl]
MTRHCLTRESETVRQRYILKKKQHENTVTLFAAEQDTAEQDKKHRPEENPLHQMQAGHVKITELQSRLFTPHVENNSNKVRHLITDCGQENTEAEDNKNNT